ncbi:glucose-induced degradation protein 8 homolog [Leguminivora glycinivorella]|uniref:glucose-induced degradation protein 8 homolog n=1 Tax=Leguminivora glycinivorella TaxID=1035111 RepID=UPI00200F4B51|nr:glucose-induced degradation protein 8 homolog [Leguminivora glycinivorella]
MSFDQSSNSNSTSDKPDRKVLDRSKTDDLQISRTDMNMLIMNYLVTEGFKEAALKFQQEAGLQEPALCSSLDERIMIREAVQSGRIPDAIAMVNSLHPELLDNDRYLYFHLQQLQLLELIRAGRAEEALSFASATLAEAGANDRTALTELERSLALLAFPDPHASPFADLLLPSHSQKIASELNAAILKMENQEYTNPKLCSLLRMILWSQSELDKHNIKYPKMTDLANATIENPSFK